MAGSNQLRFKTCFVLNTWAYELVEVVDGDLPEFSGGKLKGADEFFAGCAGELIEGTSSSGSGGC